MASLDHTLRRQLENKVEEARRVAEAGTRQAIEQLAVHHHEPWGALTPDQRKLRNRLRAHGRQLGDLLDERKGTQTIDRLVGECAYEHWHRLLFARFLAENDLLVEPESGIALSLDECRELAREKSSSGVSPLDWLMLASDFAQRMLPQIFRTGDPVLEVTLPPEKRQELEAILEALPREVFVMVLFLLHNTLGAWWAGKVLAMQPKIAKTALSESELRKACALPGTDWEYLRFMKGDDGTWRPAAGTFNGWPKAAKDVTVLDPCMGSGHFLVFALPILVAFRMEEEQVSQETAVEAVLRNNLFGLEIDPRCTQIAAFNLAFAAWKLGGYRPLPALNLACSGLGLNTKKEEWLKLAGGDMRLRNGMERLYELFDHALVLGSLINPRVLGGGNLFVAESHDLQPLLDKILTREVNDDVTHELAVTARGVAKAAEILASQFTLVATNIPFLGRPDQVETLKDYCESFHYDGRHDLATCFIEHCLVLSSEKSATALVTPQSWLDQPSYSSLRKRLLSEISAPLLARLGPRAFETISGERVNVCLCVLEKSEPTDTSEMLMLAADELRTLAEKAERIRMGKFVVFTQSEQRNHPDSVVLFGHIGKHSYLSEYAFTAQGFATSDNPPFIRQFWEFSALLSGWIPALSAPAKFCEFAGRSELLLWEDGQGAYYHHAMALKREGRLGGWKSGAEAWGKHGVLVSEMGQMTATIFTGEMFDHTAHTLIPKRAESLPAIWSFVSSPDFREVIRKVSQKLNITNETLVKVPFDLAHWQHVAAEKYPHGLPQPYSDDPTQWLFDGCPVGARVGAASGRSGGGTPPPLLHLHSGTLQVAVARLLGYRWPRQTGSSFMDCPALGPDGLEKHADDDGIVCLISLKGEQSAADRLRALLADAFTSEWSAAKLNQLLDAVGFGGKSLEDWLRDGFFEQHCDLFHQRPFIWQIWDGLKNGFSALVNYHRLCGSNVEAASGRLAQRRDAAATLEKLIYTYLGDWIDRQRTDQRAGVEGADARVAAAEHLKRELEKILEGEPPYDIFVRWKPLHEQLIGWEPDLNDGVRINIRPFMTAKPFNARGKNACILRVTPKIKWEKDRGKEPSRPKDEYPWFWGWDEQAADFLGSSKFDGNRWNNLHYSRATKLTAKERKEMSYVR